MQNGLHIGSTYRLRQIEEFLELSSFDLKCRLIDQKGSLCIHQFQFAFSPTCSDERVSKLELQSTHIQFNYPKPPVRVTVTARRSDITAARLAEVGRRWCHCLYAWEACVWQRERERKATEEDGARRAEKNVE